jgi:triosephosphate isomerase
MSLKPVIGASMKMYFGYQQTLEWCRAVSGIIASHPLTQREGQATLFTFPSAPAIEGALQAFRGTTMGVGAQNVSSEPPGAWTGEVSAAMLQEMGCRYVEIGHAERRRHFFETDELIQRKVNIALQHGLTPVVCIGEPEQLSPANATRVAIEQARQVLGEPGTTPQGAVIFAWEPQWAIGAPQPAGDDYIREVCSGLRAWLQDNTPDPHRVIYGGSAGPGLLSQLWPDVDGLFLGRFAHQPEAYRAILDEAAALSGAL